MNRLEEIRARCEAATPGPWHWDVFKRQKAVALESARYKVMGFARFGPQSAQPTFRVDGIMEKAQDLAKSIPGMEHHEGFDDFIDHPDAAFIAHAREDIPWLLDEVARLTAERDAEKRRVDAAEADLKSLSTYKPCQICKTRDTCRAAWDINGCVGFRWRGPEPGGEDNPQEARRMAPDIFTGEIG